MLIGLAWLIAAAGAVGAAVTLAVAPSDTLALARVVATLVLEVAAPLAVVLVGIELVRRPQRDDDAGIDELEVRTAAAGAATAAIRDGLLDVDATLAAIASRLDDIRGRGAGLVDAAARLEAAAGTMTAAGDGAAVKAHELGLLMPGVQREADAVAATLATCGTETARRLGEVETMLAGVWTRNVDAREQVAAASATMTGLLGKIAVAAADAGDVIAARTATLDASVDAALDRTTAALDATRDAVHVQTNAMLASVDQARVALDEIGGAAARGIVERIERAVAATDALGARLDDHDARSAAMVAAIERSFAVLDKRLGHAATMGTATLDGFHTRMSEIRAVADTIDPPLAAANIALRDAEATTGRLAESATTALAALAEGLPAQHAAVAGLTADVAALTGQTARLADPVAAAVTSAAALAGELVGAQETLTAIEGTARGSALTASGALIEVLGRVREVANATAGTMRTTLEGVVAEAEAALANAGRSQAAAAFGDPIRAEIAGLEGAAAMAGAAAQATADRIAQRLLGLTAAVATVEARMDAVEGQGNSHSPDLAESAKSKGWLRR